MRNLAVSLCVFAACTTTAPAPQRPPAASAPKLAAAAPEAPIVERFVRDTERKSAAGTAKFLVPAGWSIATTGAATRLVAPEGDAPIASAEDNRSGKTVISESVVNGAEDNRSGKTVISESVVNVSRACRR